MYHEVALPYFVPLKQAPYGAVLLRCFGPFPSGVQAQWAPCLGGCGKWDSLEGPV